MRRSLLLVQMSIIGGSIHGTAQVRHRARNRESRQLRARATSGAATKSNEVLYQLGPDIQWVESYVADDKTFCVYLAKDEAIIRKHAEISGFPATKITEVQKDDRSNNGSCLD